MASSAGSLKKSLMLVCDYSLNYLGGAQTAFVRQIEALLREGHAVTVVAPHATAALKHLGSPLLTVVDPQVKAIVPGIELPLIGAKKKLQKRLDLLLASDRIGGVIVHSEFYIAAEAARIAARYNIPVFQTVHTFFWRAPRALGMLAPLVTLFHTRVTGLPKTPQYTGSTRINNALRSMTLRFTQLVDGVISPSKHQAEQLLQAGAKNVHVVSNVLQKFEKPAAVEKVEEIEKADTPAGTEPLRLVWAGRFAPEKRLKIALDAMRIISQRVRVVVPRDTEIELHVAGGDLPVGLQKDFDAKVRVIGHGKVENHEVPELIKKSDAVLVTSNGFDNQPMIALEGFAKAKPVIVSDPALKSEFGDASILTKNASALALAKTILELAKNPHLLEKPALAAEDYARARQADMHVLAVNEILEQHTKQPQQSFV